MKKFLLSVAAVAMTLPVFGAKWAVVGAYTNPSWNFEASAVMTGEGDEVSCTIEKLIPDFKIVDIENNNWDIQYGAPTPVVIGEPVVLQGKVDGKDAPNTSFANGVLVANNAKVIFNTKTFTLLIESDNVETGFPDLYIVGSPFNNWVAPGEDGSVEFPHNDKGIYSVKADFGEAGGEFKFAGAGWSNEIASGDSETEISISDATVAYTVGKGGKNLKTTLTGEQTVTFNINNLKLTFGDPSLVEDKEEGINEVVVDSNVEAVYYNLQGVRVANPQNGVFIVKRGNEVSKVLVK